MSRASALCLLILSVITLADLDLCSGQANVAAYTATDCVVSSWSSWSDCSPFISSCRGIWAGEMNRSRHIVSRESCGGNRCPNLVDTYYCNISPCCVECCITPGEWSGWSDCAAGCDVSGRTSVRTRNDTEIKCGYNGRCIEETETRACDRWCANGATVTSDGCLCPRGWTGQCCEGDMDECMMEADSCHADATCTNTEGSFTCSCNVGYTGDGVTCTGSQGGGSALIHLNFIQAIFIVLLSFIIRP